MKFSFALLIALLFCQSLYAQTPKKNAEKATRQYLQAIQLAKNDPYTAISLLKDCQKLDPDVIVYPLQIAFTHYLNGDYAKALRLLENLQYHPQANPSVYVLTYQCWQKQNDLKRAMSFLDKGLKRFPNSGRLSLEKALYYYDLHDSAQCMQWLNRGIRVEPTFSKNYFYKTIMLLSQHQNQEAQANAEMFALLTEDQQIPQNISKLLFQLQVDSARKLYALNDTAGTARLNIIRKEYVISSIDSLCSKLLSANRFGYYQSSNAQLQNSLNAIHQTIVKAGHFEAYIHWLYSYGDRPGFKNWTEVNEITWKNFQTWHKRFVQAAEE